MTDVRVTPFLVSELRLPDEERALLGIEWWPSYGHAVEHPGGIFLFDNGAGSPGIRLVPTPGHTAGHQSLVIDEPGGAIVLAGQAVRSRDEWEGADGPEASGRSSAPDPGAYARSVEHLRLLDPVRVHFAHDPSVWER